MLSLQPARQAEPRARQSCQRRHRVCRPKKSVASPGRGLVDWQRAAVGRACCMTTSMSDVPPVETAVAPASLAWAGVRARRRAWACLAAAFAVWCTIAIVVVGTGLNYRRNATDSPPAVLNVERGNVFYEGAGSPDQVRARPGMSADEGSAVEVGDNGRASLELFDGSVLRLLGNTRLE